MHLEVWITSDRRSEVAIVVTGQRIVAFMLGRVNRLLQAPQEAEVHRVFLGLTRRLAEDSLKLESALRQLEREPQTAGKLGEAVELERVRVGVNSSQEAGVILGQVRRDRFVGRQHELLDDLVALVVHGQMCASYLPLLAQLDGDLGKVQLQGAPGEPALA